MSRHVDEVRRSDKAHGRSSRLAATRGTDRPRARDGRSDVEQQIFAATEALTPLDRLAALDPTGIFGGRFVTAARRLPGVGLWERQYQRLETALLRELDQRLTQLQGADQRALPAGTPLDQRSEDVPANVLEALLRRSIDLTPAQSERALADALVRELVPDEARILAALSDGSAFPLVEVSARGAGGALRPVLSNASSVGRAAGVVLPERVPIYVTHLIGLGLARAGPEDGSLGDEYEILLTDPAVRAALDEAGRSGWRSARVVRGTVRISDLGATVWAAFRPDDPRPSLA